MSALIDVQSLYARREDATLRMIDATYPANPGAYAQARIGNAVLFDIDAVCDHGTALPHMLPRAGEFAAAVGAMGIGNDDTVVVYDQTGMVFAASRVWWMFRAFGHERVYVLDGGLPAWQKAGMPLERGSVSAPAAKPYTAHFDPALVRSAQEVQAALGDDSTVLLDARPADRFAGRAPEPRPGMRAGHIPGSRNIPAGSLIDPATGRLVRDNPQIMGAVSEKPASIITTCGSGVTACVLALALHEAGWPKAAVYDGSWSEWGAESSGLPIAR